MLGSVPAAPSASTRRLTGGRHTQNPSWSFFHGKLQLLHTFLLGLKSARNSYENTHDPAGVPLSVPNSFPDMSKSFSGSCSDEDLTGSLCGLLVALLVLRFYIVCGPFTFLSFRDVVE